MAYQQILGSRVLKLRSVAIGRNELAKIAGISLAALVIGGMALVPAQAETLKEALVSAYQNNPTLNAQRAATRAADENVAQANGGYRPTVSLFAGLTSSSQGDKNGSYVNGGIQVQQSIYNGGKTGAQVASAEAGVEASRAQLRATEQTVLENAVEAYVNMIRDTQIVDLRASNVRFLTEQVRAAQNRFDVGQGTQTDVAQAQAQLAAGKAALTLAQATLNASRGVYTQIIGHAPAGLTAPSIDGLPLPNNLNTALDLARGRNPSIAAAAKALTVAEHNVDVAFSSLLPQITATASLSRQAGSGDLTSSVEANVATIGANMTIPLYEGGVAYSAVRQTKELVGQRQMELDAARASVDSAVVTAFGNLDAARGSIAAGQSQVAASELALKGVIAEQQVGQKTTLDVLNAQNDLVTAKVMLVRSQRDAIAAGYLLLQATGGLSAGDIKLAAKNYDPKKHYDAVHDKWIGLRIDE